MFSGLLHVRNKWSCKRRKALICFSDLFVHLIICPVQLDSFVDWMMDLSRYYGFRLTLIFRWLFAEDLVNRIIVLLLPEWRPSGSSKSWRIFRKILLLHAVQVCPPLGPPFLPNLNSSGLRSRHGKAEPLENFICREKVRSWGIVGP